LKAGGERAPVARTAEFVHDTSKTSTGQQGCPICGSSLKDRSNGFWRCATDASHYWQWRGEQNNGAIRRFLTQPHPAKQGPFYEMSQEERDAFLALVRNRMHAGGYTPHSSGGNGNDRRSQPNRP
jgi:hypothetical protein